MELHCLRHGTTHDNRAHRFNGMRGDGLTEEHLTELSTVSFESADYDVIYCSPLNRCIETAQALKIASWREEKRITERKLGVFEGLTAAQCQEQFPSEFAAFLGFDADFVIPGGESRAEHLARILAWLEEASSHNKVLAITHGGTIDFLYRLGSGFELHGGEVIFAGENSALSIFDVNWPNVRLVGFNDELLSR